MDILTSIIFGIVEGFTEFMPVSSTGHLILLSKLLDIKQNDFHKTYEIVIQLGSILAVVVIYYRDFMNLEIIKKLIIAFIPTGIIGLLFYKLIRSFFDSNIVAYMLIIGGFIFIIVELFYIKKQNLIDDISKISYKKAFLIGLFQSISMIPGTSRSGATIIGGLLIGLDRHVAAKFSFLLAVPTMIIASCYDMFKHYETFDFTNITILAVGFVSSFIFALIAIKLFIKLLTKYGFVPFGIYRIIVGFLFLLVVL
jgi:undecaprenyl-diphosphatase